MHRRDEFRGEKILRDRVFNHPKIAVVWDSVVEEIKGDEKPVLSVTGVRVRNVKTGKEQTLPASGAFVAIGHDPATKLFKGQVTMDEAGYIITKPDSTATNIAGSVRPVMLRIRYSGRR